MIRIELLEKRETPDKTDFFGQTYRPSALTRVGKVLSLFSVNFLVSACYDCWLVSQGFGQSH